MKRIDTATKAVDLFGAGKHGFKDGNLGLGVLPTDFDASICNNLQEEPANLVEAAGLVLDGNVRTQVAQAIKRIAGANVTTVTFAMSPFALTADHAGLVLVDCTGGNVVLNLPAASVVAGLPIRYVAVKTDASVNTGTFNRAGANTIDGAPSFALATQYQSRTIRSNAVDGWASIGASGAASTGKQIQSINATVAASALTLTLNPTQLDFRATPLTSGTVNARTLAAAASLVVPSTATLGTTNAVASRLVLLALDNAGAIELAVVNLSGGNNLDETSLISTTAISATATAANVIYSTTARAVVAYRVVGYVESTQAIAGTWATAPSTIQGVGGNASGNQIVRNALNAAGAAPMFACRAWVNFDGTTGAIRASGNVTSVTYNAVGDYTVNFTTAMPDLNFCAVGNHNGTTQNLNPSMISSTTSSYRFSTSGGAGTGTGVSFGNVNPAAVQMSFFR